MTPELTALALAALLQAAQFALVSATANYQLGVAKTASPRDHKRLGGPLEAQLNTRNARLFRAMNNHFEALIRFTIAVVVVTLSGQSGPVSAAAGYTYLAARVAYVPAYYFGLVPWRSLIYFVGFAATFVMILSALI